MSDLLELAERCEAAVGPSVRLDVQIEIACNPDRECIIGNKPGPFPQDPIYGTLSDFWEWALEEDKEPPVIQGRPYTASLDAAMMLVPGDFHTELRGLNDAWYARVDATASGASISTRSNASASALALCAAALKARAAIEERKP